MLTDELIEKMIGDADAMGERFIGVPRSPFRGIEPLPEEVINDLVALATNVWCDLSVHAVSLSRLQI
jgi:hypothetical protein